MQYNANNLQGNKSRFLCTHIDWFYIHTHTVRKSQQMQYNANNIQGNKSRLVCNALQEGITDQVLTPNMGLKHTIQKQGGQQNMYNATSLTKQLHGPYLIHYSMHTFTQTSTHTNANSGFCFLNS